MAQSVTVKSTGCGFREEIKYLFTFIFHFFALVSRTSAALSSATQHAMYSEFGRKWGTECLNIRFPLPALQSAGYSVKLKKIYVYIFFCRYFCVCAFASKYGSLYNLCHEEE